jgi:hypothetical protein
MMPIVFENKNTLIWIRLNRLQRMCHQVNKAWCELNGDNTQRLGSSAAMAETAIKGVEFKLDNPDAGHDAQHNAWMADNS